MYTLIWRPDTEALCRALSLVTNRTTPADRRAHAIRVLLMSRIHPKAIKRHLAIAGIVGSNAEREIVRAKRQMEW